MKNIIDKITKGEFSKRLLVFLELFILMSFILVSIAVFKGMVEGLVAWLSGLFGLASIAFGFYYWKAKNENLNKYAKTLDQETYDRLLSLIKKYEEESNGYRS